jgi:hypothetical protein
MSQATKSQVKVLADFGVPRCTAGHLTQSEATSIINAVVHRWHKKQASLKQIQMLARYGMSPREASQLSHAEAIQMVERLKKETQ